MTVATRAVLALVIDGGMVAGAQPFTTERKAS